METGVNTGNDTELADFRLQNQLITHLLSILNTDLPIEEIVQQMGSVLQEGIPCDRFSLGLILMDRWYFWENNRLTSEDGALSLLLEDEEFSASRWVVANRKPLLRQDLAAEQRFKHDSFVANQYMHSDLVVPLIVNDEVVGTFNFTSQAVNRYHTRHLETAWSVADAIAVAVKQVQSRQQADAIQEIAVAVQRSLNLDEILKMVVTHIRVQGYDRVRLYTYNQAQNTMMGQAEIGLGLDSEFYRTQFPVESDPYTQKTLVSNRPCIYQTETPEYEAIANQRKTVLSERLRSQHSEWCEIPLKVVEANREIAVGKISLDNAFSKRPLIDVRLDHLMVYASQAAVAIRHAQMHQEAVGHAEHLKAEVEARTAELKAANEQLQREIAERKQVEEEMIRLERLRALGEMSAGISHNLNNMLTAILGPAQLLELTQDDPQVLPHVETIIASAQKAADLVKQLHLSTQKPDREALQPVQVNQIVKEAVQATRPKWKDESESRGILLQVITQLEDVSPICSIPSKLHDVLVNLLLNAVDATSDGGTITVSTRPVNQHVQIQVSDTGIGMNNETRLRVFEPFFTTKKDVGSGLGLSTVYSLITGWDGQIEVESSPGEGTIFTIQIPIWKESDPRKEPTQDIRSTRRGKLLIVEDDDDVSAFLARFLRQNHDVDLIENGRTAVEKFVAHIYDAILIDLGLPGLSGDQVLQAFRETDPSFAAILVTGWQLEDTDPRVIPFDFCLPKPLVNLKEVERVVTQAIILHDERTQSKP